MTSRTLRILLLFGWIRLFVRHEVSIRVNAIGPWYIETHMTQMIEFAPEERKQQLYGSSPMGRRGRPIEIANTALFLASDESSYFTGEILHPDGGFFTE